MELRAVIHLPALPQANKSFDFPLCSAIFHEESSKKNSAIGERER